MSRLADIAIKDDDDDLRIAALRVLKLAYNAENRKLIQAFLALPVET
jgi:hypothetical protein